MKMQKCRDKQVVFLSALCIGVIVHSFMLFNKFSWHDDIGIVTLGATVSSGRWGIQLFADIYKFFIGDVTSMPVIEGILFFALVGCAGVFIGQMLNIKSTVGNIILGGVLVIFPAVTGMFGYMFHMIWYAFGIFFAVLAVYLLEKLQIKVFGLLGSIACICLSLSMYQAFLPLTASLMLLVMGKMIIDSKGGGTKVIIYKGLGCGVSVVFGLILYIYVAKWYVRQYGQELSNYRNINQMGNIALDQLISGTKNAYHNFLFMPKNALDFLFMGKMWYVYYIVLAVSLFFIIGNLICIYKKNRIHALLYVLTLGLFPLAVNLVYLYGAGGVSALMKYSQVMVFIMLIFLCENVGSSFNQISAGSILRKISIGVLLFSMFFYARFANKCYLKAGIQQSETVSWFNTLITQIKSVDGYNDEYKIAYVNKGKINDLSAYQRTPVTDVNLIPYSDEYLYNNYAFITYMKVWCGFYQAEIDDYTYFENNLQVQQMPSYPDDGSIKIIDDVIVVKF